MATTYTKSIANLHAYKNQDGLQNVAYKATLRYTATDEDTETSVYTEEIYKFEAPDPNTFVDFTSLTEETVLSWINADEDHLKAVVDRKLQNRIKSIDTFNKLPWVPEEEGTLG
jgi:hypothetical protein